VLQPDSRLLGQTLQSDPLKLGSCKFNIIINIKNIIICIKNIIIFIIMNIANIIIDKFGKKILLIFKNNSRFDLKSQIKNYKNLGQACLIL
jgi:flagellar motor component MotA